MVGFGLKIGAAGEKQFKDAFSNNLNRLTPF